MTAGAAAANALLVNLTTRFIVSTAFFTVARLGVADALRDAPRSPADLAATVGADPRALARCLGALAAHGLFRELDDGRFALNEPARLLCRDEPGSYLPYALQVAGFFDSAAAFERAVRDGGTPFAHHYGTPIFEHLAQHPALGAHFDGAMQALHGIETAAMLEACDLAGATTFADIGGGNGDVLAATLARYPAMRGVLFERPAVLERTRERLAEHPAAARIDYVAGDFFAAVPVRADCYYLRHVLHDWDDAACRTILGHLAAGAPRGARVLLGEALLEPPNQAGIGRDMDLVMLQFTGGWQRSAADFATLLEDAGLDFVGVTPTASMISVVEARKR